MILIFKNFLYIVVNVSGLNITIKKQIVRVDQNLNQLYVVCKKHNLYIKMIINPR